MVEKIQIIIGVGLGLAIYFLLAVTLLTKDPVVFPDEFQFGSTARSWMMGELDTGEEFLTSRIPPGERAEILAHGPGYYLGLAGVYRVFGFSLQVTRLFSVFLGAVGIVVVYMLVRLLVKNKYLPFLAVCLVAVDYNYLRMARFGRPEMFVVVAGLSAMFFYLRHIKTKSSLSYWLMVGAVLFGISLHLYLGCLILGVIVMHMLWMKRWSAVGRLVLIVIVAGVGWIGYTRLWPADWDKARLLMGARTDIDFRSVRAVLAGDLLTKGVFLGYLLSFGFFLIKRRHSQEEKLLLEVGLLSWIVVLVGGLDWYLGLLVWPSCAMLVSALNRHQTNSNMWATGLTLVIFIGLFNLTEQANLLRYYADYSYTEYGKKIAASLPVSDLVFVTSLIPDPSWYLVENRTDLNLVGEYSLYDVDGERKRLILNEADTLVTYGIYQQAVEHIQGLGDQAQEQVELTLDNLASNNGLSKQLLRFLVANKPESVLVEGNKYYPPIVVYDLGENK